MDSHSAFIIYSQGGRKPLVLLEVAATSFHFSLVDPLNVSKMSRKKKKKRKNVQLQKYFSV